jgi:hypothetical protein
MCLNEIFWCWTMIKKILVLNNAFYEIFCFNENLLGSSAPIFSSIFNLSWENLAGPVQDLTRAKKDFSLLRSIEWSRETENLNSAHAYLKHKTDDPIIIPSCWGIFLNRQPVRMVRDIPPPRMYGPFLNSFCDTFHFTTFVKDKIYSS